jgi:hypothetical protein
MESEFEKLLVSCEIERLEGLYRRLEKSHEINALKCEAAMILEKVRNLLQNRPDNLLSAYADTLNSISSLECAFMYKQGLKDGIQLGQLLFDSRKNIDINVKVL